LKTKNAKRIVGLHATLCATLRQIRPAKLKPHGFVVTNLRGEPIRPGAFSELWYDALRKLDPPIPPRGLDRTKHTFCSLTVSSGRPQQLVRLERQMGEPSERLRRHHAIRRSGYAPTGPTTPLATRRCAIGARDEEGSGREVIRTAAAA
jgi:hypothetical protein